MRIHPLLTRMADHSSKSQEIRGTYDTPWSARDPTMRLFFIHEHHLQTLGIAVDNQFPNIAAAEQANKRLLTSVLVAQDTFQACTLVQQDTLLSVWPPIHLAPMRKCELAKVAEGKNEKNQTCLKQKQFNLGANHVRETTTATLATKIFTTTAISALDFTIPLPVWCTRVQWCSTSQLQLLK